MRINQRLSAAQSRGWVPLMPTGNYKTYAIRSPLATHTRAATCEEYGCEAYANGWQIRVENMTEEDKHAVRTSGKRYREVRLTEGETYFVFESGQPCFAARQHRVSLDRPEWYFVGRGDRRSFSTRQARRHSRPEDWVDDMQTNFDTIRTEIEKG
jgi:hypothetical protein